MVDKSRMTLQKLARWHPNQSHPVQDRKGSTALWEGTLQPLDHEDLKQGALYIIKIHHVSVGLFQGWNDDMCCFAVLRSENTPMRWSQARYLPGDFDAFDAFDEAGNPPVHLWTRYLRVEVPINWFAIFEEARRKQREWATHILEQQQHQHQQQQQHHHHLHAPSALPAGMMMGGNSGGYPSLMTAMHHHQQHQQHSALMDDDYNDLGSFSAAPSQSLRSERLSSISSLPLDPQHGNEAISLPISTQPTNISYSPPQSPTPSNLTASHSHQPDTTVPPVDEKAEINADRTTATNSNQKQHTTSTTTSSSSPNVTTGTTQIPLTPTSSLSPTTTTTTTTATATAAATEKSTKRRSSVNVTPSQKLEMELALGDLSFPHDDDRFSIHSGYQPSLHLRDSSPTSPEMDPHGYHTNHSWKKRSIKKMLSRSSNSVK